MQKAAFWLIIGAILAGVLLLGIRGCNIATGPEEYTGSWRGNNKAIHLKRGF
jgi:hypothetical protein